MSKYEGKELEKSQTCELTWHGDDTLVLIEGAAEKIEVKKGDTIKVSVKQAKRLVRYSDLWTLKGDQPLDQPWREAQKAALARLGTRGQKKTEASEEEVPADLTEADVDAMTTKNPVLAALKLRNIKVNSNASLDELKAVLKESLAAAEAPEAPAQPEEAQSEEKKASK